MVIEPAYGIAIDFSEGLAAVWVFDENASQGGQWGFIDPTGKMVIEPAFDQKQSKPRFRDGLAAVWKGDAIGYINHTGAFVYEPTK
jgi:hypothetical protein